MRVRNALALVLVLAGVAVIRGQRNHPAGEPHAHLSEAQLHDRGRLAMGFDQTRATHHFLIRSDGGVISVDVNDPDDDANRQAIRAHLRRIRSEFAQGRFDAPLATHGEEPPGTRTLKALAKSISYSVDDTPNGGRVRIASTDARAVTAIHDFLRYQIREHRTGDPLR